MSKDKNLPVYGESKFRLEYRLYDRDVDKSILQSTGDLGWNLTARGLKEFADKYPDGRFVVGVRE